MPGRLRQSAVQTNDKAKLYNIAGLDFDEPLSWRPGKAIPVADLLSRLQNLSTQLRSFDEDQEAPSEQFAPLAVDLANPNLLGHKDKGVRALTLSCIVDVLKLCAPEAPFVGDQLKNIFKVFIDSILPLLADPSNPYNNDHVYILHILSESQSILLLADVDEPETLLASLFTHTFDILSATNGSAGDLEISKSVEFHLKNLLCTVVEEVDIPQEVIDIIISQFLRVDVRKAVESNAKGKKTASRDQKQGTLLVKDYPPAYNMAKAICTACQDKMTAQITQYFNAVIVDAASAAQNQAQSFDSHRRASGLVESDDEDDGLADLRKAHRLLKELWRACPDIIVNVIPQVEAELSADSIQLRQLATETLGDIAAGIGIAGLPSTAAIDPSVYPLPSIRDTESDLPDVGPVLTPASPKPFSTVHRTTFENLMGRRNDKAPSVRVAWSNAVSRILATSAGGIGIQDDERSALLSGYAQMLRDSDERVRLAAIKSMSVFPYKTLVNTLGQDGGLSQDGTIFSTLAERFTDRKHLVRDEAINLAATLWGVASRDIEEGEEGVVSVLGDIPSRLLAAYFTNDPHIHVTLDKVMYESLIPLSFPPIKATTPKTATQRRRTRDAESGSQESLEQDPDSIRARRILTLLKNLNPRAKQVFMGMQGRQVQLQKGVTAFLKACEDYNGGVVEEVDQEANIKSRLKTYIEALSKQFADQAKVSQDLQKFADMHNRRDYQLIRFAMSPESDFKTVQKAIKELSKRIREGPASSQSLIETLMPLLYRSALIVYNRSHVPAIMDISRSDLHGLAEAAHEILGEISARNPEVLKTHIQALCKELEENAPSASDEEEPGAGDTLKACSHFARKYPSEVPSDRKFLNAMANFAVYSRSPQASKHAVSIILTISNRKELQAKEILTKTLKDCTHESPLFLPRLAAIAQVCLLAPAAASAETDAILNLTVKQILHKNRKPKVEDNPNAWESDPSPETQAKELALKVMVNRCRSERDKEHPQEFDNLAKPVFALLMQLIQEDGEITPKKDTPAAQRNHLRLAAARFVLKLCSHRRRCEEFVTPPMFNSVALIVINPPNAVRIGFVNQLKKYLGQNKLNHRWLTVLFLLAFEPDEELRNNTVTWLRSRMQYFDRQQQQSKSGEKRPQQHVMEGCFARLLSLMVHHPDYPDKHSAEYDVDLLDFSKYITFYLVSVANDENLSLIFHIAQRIKQTQDNIVDSDEMSERLYVLSDLAQAVIKNYADMMPTRTKGVNVLQTYPGNVSLPRSLFKALPSHAEAQKLVDKNFLPEETALGLEKLIKDYTKSIRGSKSTARRVTYADKKRKGGSVDREEEEEARRRAAKKKKALPIRKTPKSKRTSDSTPASTEPSRKSSRKSTSVSYAEADSDEGSEVEGNEGLASSPVGRRVGGNGSVKKTPALEKEKEANTRNGDTEMTEDNVKENEDIEDDDDDEVVEEPEREVTPSPLKEKENPSAKKSRLKRKSTPKKATPEPPARATRQTRRTKS